MQRLRDYLTPEGWSKDAKATRGDFTYLKNSLSDLVYDERGVSQRAISLFTAAVPTSLLTGILAIQSHFDGKNLLAAAYGLATITSVGYILHFLFNDLKEERN